MENASISELVEKRAPLLEKWIMITVINNLIKSCQILALSHLIFINIPFGYPHRWCANYLTDKELETQVKGLMLVEWIF